MSETGSGGQNNRPSALEEAFERYTQELSAAGGTLGGPQLPRRSITFTVDHTVCAPGVFEEDFELTLRTLTPAQELQAARSAGGDAVAMGFAMAQASLYAVDGQPLDQAHREFLWQVLDQAGRNLVVQIYTQLGTPSEEAAGKARGSLRVG